MNALGILFLHHNDAEISRHHAALMKRLNPGAAFVPLTFGAGLKDALRLPVENNSEWLNADKLVFAWFQSPNRVEAERYMIVEYDTLCTVPFQYFYATVWDEAVASARVVTPASEPDWQWFPAAADRAKFEGNLMGLRPLSGILLSHTALAKMSELAQNPIYDALSSECRMGTLARAAGYQPVSIGPEAGEYMSWTARLPGGPGIWHPVKTKLFSSAEVEAIFPMG